MQIEQAEDFYAEHRERIAQLIIALRPTDVLEAFSYAIAVTYSEVEFVPALLGALEGVQRRPQREYVN